LVGYLAVASAVQPKQFSLDAVVAELDIPVEDQNAFTDLLRQELTHLEAFNCARYRLGIPLAEHWVQAGRPGIFDHR
jgi:hypothetical protein